MVKHLFPYQKAFSKWLLSLSILFSGFAFFGYTDNLIPDIEELAQTEQLFSGNDTSKNSISYIKAVKFWHISRLLTSCIREQKYALLLSNQRYIVSYNTISNQVITFDFDKCFMQYILYPQSSKQEPSLSLIGSFTSA